MVIFEKTSTKTLDLDFVGQIRRIFKIIYIKTLYNFILYFLHTYISWSIFNLSILKIRIANIWHNVMLNSTWCSVIKLGWQLKILNNSLPFKNNLLLMHTMVFTEQCLSALFVYSLLDYGKQNSGLCLSCPQRIVCKMFRQDKYKRHDPENHSISAI